jgi:DNA-3-methyladenine glycosylase II
MTHDRTVRFVPDNPPRTLSVATLRAATQLLAARDPDLACIVRGHGVPPMWGRPTGFPTLVWIILEQQVSIVAARTMFRRLRSELGGEVSPECVAECGVEGLRTLGLTRQKAGYCHGLALRILGGALDLRALGRMADAEARSELLAVPGLGPWSVDIYFLMALRRPDIWPQGDLALAVALRKVKRLRRVPTSEVQARIARLWSPWRSVAARILWTYYLAR